jgi:alanyl-tRNA synthetase
MSRIEEFANGRVLQNGLVRQNFMPRDLAERKFGFRLYQGGSVPGGELRVVEFRDWDVEACGGTHVSNASDVGPIKILRSTRIQDGVVRLEYAAGKAAIDAIQQQSRVLAKTAEALGVAEAQVADAAVRLSNEARSMRRELEKIHSRQKKGEAKDLLENPEFRFGDYKVVRYQVTGSMSDLMKISKEICADSKATAILGSASSDGAYLIVSRGADVPINVLEAFDPAIALLDGRGGGKADFAQGKGPKTDALQRALDEAERLVKERLRGQSG